MKRVSLFIAILLGIAALAYGWTVVGAVAPALPLHTIGEYPLTGTSSRFDYASIDAARGVVWVAHMGDGSVEGFDVHASRVTRTIQLAPSASIRGVLAARGKVYAAAQGLGRLVVFDGASGQQVAAVPAGDVDGIAYDPVTQRIFVSDEGGGRDTVVDARTNARLGAVELGGEAGNTVYDSASRHIFVGVQTRDELAEIDPQRLRAIRRYPLPGCSSSHSVLIDAAQRAAYVGCQHNMRLVRLDLRTGKVAGSGGTGLGVDVLAIDPGLHRLYAASESGVVSVYDVAGGKFDRIAQAFVHLNAHVVVVDSATHRVYFPLQNVNGKPAMRVMEPQ